MATPRAPKFESAGQKALSKIGQGPSALAVRLREFTKSDKPDTSSVSRWRSGASRPDAFWRSVMFKSLGIPESAWLLSEERSTLNRKGAA